MSLFDIATTSTLPTDVPFTTPPVTPEEAEVIEAAYREVLESVASARRMLSSAAMMLHQDAGTGFDFRIDAPEQIARKIWRELLWRHPVTLVMSEKRRKAFHRGLEDGEIPPITAVAIMAKMAELEQAASAFLNEWALETAVYFIQGSVDRPEDVQVPRKVHMGYVINWSGRSYKLTYRTDDILRGLDRLFHHLDGQPQPLFQEDDAFEWPVMKKTPLLLAISEAGKQGRQTGETGYFRFAIYKNGGLQLTFKRDDLLADLARKAKKAIM